MNKFSKIYNKIFDYTLVETSPLVFSQLVNTTNKLSKQNMIKISSSHLYKEIPIRFAHRIQDLNLFPYGLNHNHNVNLIRDWYLTSFEELVKDPEPKTQQEIEQFGLKIKNIYNRHSPTILTLTKGLFELKENGLIEDKDDKQVQIFLNRFYSSRTEIRILIEHYLQLFENYDKYNNYNGDNNSNTNLDKINKIGIINFNSDVLDTLDKVISNIAFILDRTNYDVNLEDIIKISGNTKITTIDNYLYYILFEIIKNSVQAIITSSNTNKKIQIKVIDLEDYVNVKITDNGIGIKEEDLHKIWLYSYSTNPIEPKKIIEQEDFSTETPLSGFGYGLPISKIYLNFFSSMIQIDSVYKKGTYTNIFFKKLISI